MKRKLTAYIITAAVISSAVCALVPPTYADGDVINVASREDWETLKTARSTRGRAARR